MSLPALGGIVCHVARTFHAVGMKQEIARMSKAA